MKKAFAFILITGILLSYGCTQHIGPAPITELNEGGTYTNSGKIKSQSLGMYYSYMTFTANTTFYYDTTGKIMREDKTVAGYPSDSTYYTYTASGKLSSKGDSAGSVFLNTYTYDSSDRLATMTTSDTTDSTEEIMTFSYGSDNLISVVDETRNGIPSSHRVVFRDGSGFITREDIYSYGGSTVNGQIIYTRNDVLKTITIDVTLMSNSFAQAVIEYDANGFYKKQTITMSPGGLSEMSIVYDNVIQNGLFDPAGMNGYYYTDKDTFGVFWIYIMN